MKRTEIPEIIDGTHPDYGLGVAYAFQALIVLSAIVISVETVPGLPPGLTRVLRGIEFFVLVVFALEYLTRVVCARNPLRYIFSFWGAVDLLAWLPILLFLEPQWAAVRFLRALRLVRLLKLMHTNRALLRLQATISRIRGELMVFVFLAAIMIYIAGVGIYIFEHDAQPDKFTSIPVSLWWAVVSFTTVGYGDIYPITAQGRAFTSGILFIGLGVIAVPTALITSSLINSDMVKKIEEDVEEDIREEIESAEVNIRKSLRTKATPRRRRRKPRT